MARLCTLKVTILLDDVPGTFHTEESAQEQIGAMLRQAIPWYSPTVDIMPQPSNIK